MSKLELTQEQKDFKLDDFTLNNQLIYLLEKSKCVSWSLRDARRFYHKERETQDHVGAMDSTKREMFKLGIKYN